MSGGTGGKLVVIDVVCRVMEFKNDKRKNDLCCRLQMYKTPPENSISIKNFEEMALQRLKRKTRDGIEFASSK